MLGVRISSFGETGLGEPEQDANSALTELDKALRSEKIGEQCEAIVRFPRLFEKYPFPILINSSLLKLADVFRVGNNFLRLWVLRVCQQSEKHLDKIINVDEFVRRIFSVIHSNDPVARALTLRTLGSVAGIIPERQQVHHSIRRSLDSHDMVEVEAATYAAMQFAAQSKTFAVSMCSKISDMIRGLSTPAHMKLQLIPILQHMHHDIGTAAMVRQLCADLLPSYPAEEFVLVTLNTLTQLAAATLVDIPSQVALLLGYLRSDPRWTVQAQCLRNLHRLATHGSHLWPLDAVDEIVAVAEDPPNDQVLGWALDTLLAVAKSAAAVETQVRADSRLFRLCADVSLSAAPHIASKAVQVVTRLVCHGTGTEDPDRLSNAVDLVESLLLLVTTGTARGELRACLHCAVSLCGAHAQLCPRVIAMVSSALHRAQDPALLPPLCETLAAVADRGPRGSLLPALPALLDTLGRAEAGTEHSQATVMLCTLVFQTMTGFRWAVQPGCPGDQPSARQAIERVVAGNNLWENYRIARSAARYGRHGVSADVLRRLLAHVSSEHLHFWLAGLRELSDGEAALADRLQRPGLADRLAHTMTHYCRAVAALKAGSSPAGSLQFQTEYARLRGEFLQSLTQLVHTCHSLCTTPPPAVATAVPESNLQRYGHVTDQLRKCVKEFRVCGDLYWKLYQTAFDADPASLAHIQILQQMCVLMAHSVERVAQANYQDDVVLDFSCDHAGLEATYMIRCCQEAAAVAQQMVWAEDQKTITHQHIECLLKQVEILADTSLCLPRYFFQVLQSTTLTLMVTPKPRVLGESISVSSSAQLAIKVEGVIQHGKRPGLFRRIGGVRVTVSSQLQKQHSQDSKLRPEGDSVLAQTVAPHRDFFAAAFLLAFPLGGQYVLAVEAAVVDVAGNVWRTGPRTSLAVKSVEDGKTASQPGSSKFSSPRF